MIFPPVFLVSTSGNSNQQLQQATTTSNINIPPASAVVAGKGNLLQYGQAMAAEALSEGGGSRDGSAPAAQANAQPRSMSERSKLLRIPKPEPGLRCPRCDSTSTKFSYFNNYSFAQPRHFCRNCHRYWTRGGTLRDIPVGAPYRRRRAKGNKPGAAATASSASSAALAMTSSCTINVIALAPTPQQATASSSASPVLPQLYGLASMDTPNVGSNFSWPGAASLLVDSAGGRAVSESKMKQLRGMLSQSSQMQRLPEFSHAIGQQQGPAVAVPVTTAMPPSMFHLGLWSGGDGGIYSGGEGQFHMIMNQDEECPIWAMQADVNGYTTSDDPIPVIPQAQLEEEMRQRQEQQAQLIEERRQRQELEATQQAMAQKLEQLTQFLATSGGFTLPPGLLAPLAPPPQFSTQHVLGTSPGSVGSTQANQGGEQGFSSPATQIPLFPPFE